MKHLFTNYQIEHMKTAFNKEQIKLLSKPTPDKEIEIKIDEDGNKYKTVKGSYMKRQMNLIFGFNYDFQIVSREFISGETLVHGRLTVRSSKLTIIKEQFGKNNVSFTTKTSGNRTVSSAANIGNSYKAAATDAFKKCASELGLCWDIYSQEPEEPKKEVPEAKEATEQAQKITERFIHFLKISTSAQAVENVISNFYANSGETDIRKALSEEYRNKFKEASK
jgi:hypothetical protein